MAMWVANRARDTLKFNLLPIAANNVPFHHHFFPNSPRLSHFKRIAFEECRVIFSHHHPVFNLGPLMFFFHGDKRSSDGPPKSEDFYDRKKR